MNDMTADAIRYMEQSPYALLITVGEGSNAAFQPFARYIGPVANVGLDICFATRIASQKVGQMDNNPSVMCYFQDANQPQDGFKSLIVSGNATRIVGEVEFANALDLLGRKSPDYKKYIALEGSTAWAIYKITAASIHYTDFSKSKKTIRQDV